MPRIARAEVDRIAAHAKEAFPDEACGFLLGREDGGGPGGAAVRGIEAAVPARNEREAGERGRHFLITPAQLLEAEGEAARRGLDVVGFYHSHPGGRAGPSPYDLAHAWPWYSYLVLPITDGAPGALGSWRLRDDRSAFEPEDLMPL